MEPEWNNSPESDDSLVLGLRSKVDIDDYINFLIKQIESLKSINESLKKEVRTQRKEIANLREERRAILDSDKPPGACIRW